MEELFELIEARFDQLLPEGLNESVSQEMINEAFNSAPYPTTVEQKGSQVDFFFDDEDDSYRIQFFGAAGSWGRDVDTVYIGKQRGRVYADNIDKIKNPNKVIATFLSVFTKFIVDNPRGINKSGFAVNLSGKAAKRFAPVLKKVLARTMKGKVEVVKGFQPDAKREFVWVMRTGKKPEDVFNGKKITDKFDFSSVTGKSTNKPSSTGVAPNQSAKKDEKKLTSSRKIARFHIDSKVLAGPAPDITRSRRSAGVVSSLAAHYFGVRETDIRMGEYGDAIFVSVGFPDLAGKSTTSVGNKSDKIAESPETKEFVKWLNGNKTVDNIKVSSGVRRFKTSEFIPELTFTITPFIKPIDKPSDGTGAAKAAKPKVDDNPLAMYGFPALDDNFRPPKDIYIYKVESDFETERRLKSLLEQNLKENFKVGIASSSDRVEITFSNDSITHSNGKALDDLSKQFINGNKTFKSIIDWLKGQSERVQIDPYSVSKGDGFKFRVIATVLNPKKPTVVRTKAADVKISAKPSQLDNWKAKPEARFEQGVSNYAEAYFNEVITSTLKLDGNTLGTEIRFLKLPQDDKMSTLDVAQAISQTQQFKRFEKWLSERTNGGRVSTFLDAEWKGSNLGVYWPKLTVKVAIDNPWLDTPTPTFSQILKQKGIKERINLGMLMNVKNLKDLRELGATGLIDHDWIGKMEKGAIFDYYEFGSGDKKEFKLEAKVGPRARGAKVRMKLPDGKWSQPMTYNLYTQDEVEFQQQARKNNT